MTGSPNNQVETNRCQASRLRSWPVIGDVFCVCRRALSAAVAHLRRSAKAGRLLDFGTGLDIILSI